jgi:non-ribosomal peptide synthetase component E (peptide arylation enzyme)
MSEILPPHHQPFAESYRNAGYWRRGPVPNAIRHWADRTPARHALVDRQGVIDYATLEQIVQRTACGLWAAGIRPGDVVALQLPNWREFVFFQQAAARIGASYLLMIPQLRGADVQYVLEISKAAAVVVPDRYRGFAYPPMIEALRPGLPALRHVFIAGDGGNALTSIEAFLAQPWEEQCAEEVDALEISPDAVRQIIFTSGTESKPKGVLHSYNTAFFPLQLHREYFGLGPSDAIFTCSTVGHGTGAHFGVELGLFIGGKVVLQEKWDPLQAVEIIAREHCTMMWGATTFYNALVAAPNLAQHDLSSFRLACSAGAPIPRSLLKEVKDKLGATLVAAFGQSEGHNISINRADDPPEKVAGADGRINAGIVVKTVDDARGTLAPGEAGELAYRGPNVCLGYLEPAHTAAAFDAEGFVYSGDLVQIDDEGYLKVVGRRKDIIIRGGENISPLEIEDLLFRHPAVADVAVIAVPDERLGQRTCAVVILKPAARLTLGDVVDYFAAEQVAKFKTPEFLEIVAELPRTASGKVRKEVLRQTIAGKLTGEARQP